MAVRPYLRSSLARSLYDKLISDENLRSLDKSKWYSVDLDLVDAMLRDSFVLSEADEDTELFLEKSFEKSDWLMTQVFHAFARVFLCWFMTRTSINGLLGRGSMFVFSNNQFEKLLGPYMRDKEEWNSSGTLLDLGAGDGKVTEVMAPYFRTTYVTEISGVMQKILVAKQFKVLEVENWHETTVAPQYFNVISCLNLLDRCDRPISLLQQIKSKLEPDTGLLIVAVVLPLSQYVESGSHKPSETIEMSGGKKFEEHVSSLARGLFTECGYEVVRWTRLPYLCEGDLDQAFYWLNDAVFVLKVKNSCNP